MERHPKALELLELARELKAALQEAHFAARRMDELLRVADPEARCADAIHRLRIAAGQVSALIREELQHPAARP